MPENLQRLRKCYMAKNKWMDAEGNMNAKAFVEQLVDHRKEELSSAIFTFFKFLIFIDSLPQNLIFFYLYTSVFSYIDMFIFVHLCAYISIILYIIFKWLS